MNRVKIFRASASTDLETKINNWLKENPFIDVKSISYIGDYQKEFFSALVYYTT